MNILQKYNEENSQAPRQSLECSPGGAFGPLVCTVIRLSGGRIKSVKQADKLLLGVAIVIFLLTFFVMAGNFNLLPAERFSAQDARI